MGSSNEVTVQIWKQFIEHKKKEKPSTLKNGWSKGKPEINVLKIANFFFNQNLGPCYVPLMDCIWKGSLQWSKSPYMKEIPWRIKVTYLFEKKVNQKVNLEQCIKVTQFFQPKFGPWDN